VGGIFDGLLGFVVPIINEVIVELAAAIAAVIAVLPSMPALPTPPSQLTEVEGWVAWVFPVDILANLLVWLGGVYVLWLGVSIALRWAKAQRGNA